MKIIRKLGFALVLAGLVLVVLHALWTEPGPAIGPPTDGWRYGLTDRGGSPVGVKPR